jgi:hypothetical protein
MIHGQKIFLENQATRLKINNFLNTVAGNTHFIHNKRLLFLPHCQTPPAVRESAHVPE